MEMSGKDVGMIDPPAVPSCSVACSVQLTSDLSKLLITYHANVTSSTSEVKNSRVMTGTKRYRLDICRQVTVSLSFHAKGGLDR